MPLRPPWSSSPPRRHPKTPSRAAVLPESEQSSPAPPVSPLPPRFLAAGATPVLLTHLPASQARQESIRGTQAPGERPPNPARDHRPRSAAGQPRHRLRPALFLRFRAW